jgi:hypothetical protein
MPNHTPHPPTPSGPPQPPPWPIAPIGIRELDFRVVNYSFTGIAADALTPLPPLEDFLDATLADFAASLADQTVLIASMADDLDDLYTILDEIAVDDTEQIIADLAGIAATGDSLLNDLAFVFGNL